MSSIFARDLGLNRKTLSGNFFLFKKFSSTSTGGKCALRWFYCLEKQKLSLERTLPGKKLRFCIRYLWKMKEKPAPANLSRGVCFSMKWKATCRNWAHLDEEKQFGLKSHLWASCTQPFIWESPPPPPPPRGKGISGPLCFKIFWGTCPLTPLAAPSLRLQCLVPHLLMPGILKS